MKNTLRVADKSTNINVWASLSAEEILFESEYRSILKDKCDEIIKNLMKMENDFEDTTYFKLKKGSTARIPIEFELRKTYWEYFRVGHLYLSRYDSYFKMKIDDIIEKNKIEASLINQKDDKENEGKNFEKEEEENLKSLYREFEDKLLELKKLKEIEDELKKKLE